MSVPTAFFQPNRTLQRSAPGTCYPNLLPKPSAAETPRLHRCPALCLGSSDIQRMRRERETYSFFSFFFLPQCITGNASENGRDPSAFPSRCGNSRMAARAGNLSAREQRTSTGKQRYSTKNAVWGNLSNGSKRTLQRGNAIGDP